MSTYSYIVQVSLCPPRRFVEQVIELTHSSGESDIGRPFDCDLLLQLQSISTQPQNIHICSDSVFRERFDWWFGGSLTNVMLPSGSRTNVMHKGG